jgi:hypothetical protein
MWAKYHKIRKPDVAIMARALLGLLVMAQLIERTQILLGQSNPSCPFCRRPEIAGETPPQALPKVINRLQGLMALLAAVSLVLRHEARTYL